MKELRTIGISLSPIIAIAALIVIFEWFPRAAVCALLILIGAILIQNWKVSRRNRIRGWRLRFSNPDGISYEELHDGKWVGITFRELGDHRESIRYFDIRSEERWSEYPLWARTRRDEILGRLKSELSRPGTVLKEA